MNTSRNPIQLCLLRALLVLLPATASAQFTYTTNSDNTITITGHTGSNGVVMIPSTISGLPVTGIGDRAFYAASVTNVFIPDGVINIGNRAFFNCQSLTNVTIGSGVTSIGNWAFGFCANLKNVDCRGNAPGLGGRNVFHGNAAVFYYLLGTTGWGPTFDGHPAVLWNPPVPFTYAKNSDGITLTITGYTGSDGAVAIPSNINFLPVADIGFSAFFDTSITSVIIPDSVTSIDDYAFEYCESLTNVTIGSNVTNIGIAAFHYCIKLTAFTANLSGSFFSSIAGVLFNQSRTLLVLCPEGKPGAYTIPNGTTSVGDSAFTYCSGLTSVLIPNSVTNIGTNAFLYCTGLTNVTLPDSVTSIGNNAFDTCYSLNNVILPHSLTNLGDYAFNNCSSLISITIPKSITRIGNYIFDTCRSLTSVTLPNSITNVGDGAFAGCTSLTAIVIPNSVISIGSEAFDGCWLLNSVTIPVSASPPFRAVRSLVAAAWSM